MSYVITLSNGNELAIVADGTVNTSASSINLVGKNYNGYGALIAENMVHQLENFANASAPSTPLVGQLWYDTTTQTLMVYAGSGWDAVGLSQALPNTGYTFDDHSVTVQETTADNAGFMLYDPSAAPNQRYYRMRVRDDGAYAGHWVLESLNDDLSVNTVILDTNSSGFISLAVSPASDDSSTAIATTAWVQEQTYATVTFVTTQNYARLSSPNFAGTPTAPTPTAGDNTNKIATTAYVRATTRTLLTSDLNLYVATTGTDSLGHGLTSGTPFATMQYAANYAYANYDTQGHSVIINVADGTYHVGADLSYPMVGGGIIYLIGNTANPQNCVVSLQAPGVCFGAQFNCVMQVKGFSLSASSGSNTIWTTPGDCLAANNAGYIYFDKIIFNAAQTAHIAATAYSTVSVANAGATYTIAGGAQFHAIAGSAGATVSLAAAVVTLTGTPYFSGAFAYADAGSLLYAPSATFSGSATGPRYLATNGGYIATTGAGVNYFPGNSAGNFTTGYYT